MLARRLQPRLRRTLATLSSIKLEQHDIICVGGGPIGLTLATALAANSTISQAHKITLIEGSDLDKVSNWSLSPDSYSNRVSSITADNQAFLTSQSSSHHFNVIIMTYNDPRDRSMATNPTRQNETDRGNAGLGWTIRRSHQFQCSLR